MYNASLSGRKGWREYESFPGVVVSEKEKLRIVFQGLGVIKIYIFII